MSEIARPLVSVIIPTFDRRLMVCEAIESALAQDVSNYEVIVVDDGSTDGTAELVQAEFPQVRLISQSDRAGRSSARNRGLEVAGAPYVCFLDSDDRFEPWHLRQLTAGLKPVDAPSDEVRYGTAVYWDPQTGDTVVHKPPPYLPDDERSASLVGTFISLPTMLVPRTLATEVGGFPTSLEGSEDWVFLVRLARSGRFKRVGGPPSVRIRVHGERSMADAAWDLRWRGKALELLRCEFDLPVGDHRLLVAGHHRYRAARLYELGDMPGARAELRHASRQLGPLDALRWNGRLLLQSLLSARIRALLRHMRARLSR